MLFPFGRRFIVCTLSASYVGELGGNCALEGTRGSGEDFLYQKCRKCSLDPPTATFRHRSSAHPSLAVPRDDP